MSDRGSCKVFAPNIFNPTKCQNCYKPKEGHPSGPQQTQKIQRGISLSVARDKNAPIKTVLKEGFLSRGTTENEINQVKDWDKKWFVLYSSGELECFPFEDGEVARTKSHGITVLQDFIRMLDGSVEIGEENSLGLRSLKDALYLKSTNKVDFENWWKELSTFVPSPMKRAYSAGAAARPPLGGSKAWLNKTYSNPQQATGIKASKPRSTPSPDIEADNPQVIGLNSKIDKLQEETKRIPKIEEDKRKLELEVNYWKEYVTNSKASRKAGSKADPEKELNEARSKIISLQDDINEVEKKVKVASAKTIVQNKEVSDLKSSVQESKNVINMHKATIDDLKNELSTLKSNSKEPVDVTDAAPPLAVKKTANGPAEERITLSPVSDVAPERGETGDIESKFSTLREKMKRIEKELFLKSKELEKANESRSKVAKYTRSLLQELEAKLTDTQRRLIESNEKLNNASIELEMERERRKRLQSDHNTASRTSSVSSTKSFQEQTSFDSITNDVAFEKTETEVSNRYVDYYRSRFREAEAALYEKDKKLSESESKIKELETKYKTVVKQCRSLDDIQVKLSDATHKLSDRQLKIHELTREVEKLRGYERGYDRKSKELQNLTQNVRNTDGQVSDLRRKLSSQEKELEVFKIREVVMKERLSLLEEESSDESGEDDDDADDARLERSIEAKKRVEATIDLEGQVRLLAAENERLKLVQVELEEVKSQNNSVQKELTTKEGHSEDKMNGLADIEAEKTELEGRIKELEERLIVEEDKLFRSISELKDKHKTELESFRSAHRHEMAEFAKQKEEKVVKEKDERNESLMKDETVKLTNQVGELEKNLTEYKERRKQNETLISEKDRQILEFGVSLQDLSDSLAEKSLTISNLNANVADKKLQLKSNLDKVDYLEKLFNEKCNMVKSYENDVMNLRKKIISLEEKLFDVNERQDAVSKQDTPGDNVDSGTGSENNTELWEELKRMKEALLKSQNLTEDFRNELEDVGMKYFDSEQKVIDLARELDSRIVMENELNQLLTTAESKMDLLQKQLTESRDSMQTKADYLEKERNNVIHLVNVTSAYITELENSLTESRVKIDELQSMIEETRSTNGKRMPPEGSTGKERDDSLSDHSDLECPPKGGEDEADRMHGVNRELSGKIQMLQSNILEMKDRNEKEVSQLQRDHEEELRTFMDKLQKVDLNVEAAGDGGSPVKSEEQLDTVASKPENEFHYSDEEKAMGKTPGNMDLLNRIQELELELEETRKRLNAEMKKKNEEHKKEIDELKDDMAKALQASIASSYQAGDPQNDTRVLELEEKIKEMEKEIQELEEKYEEELNLERDAHMSEMEETIRDMLTVREVLQSGKYNENDDAEDSEGTASQKSSRRSSVASGEGMEEIRKQFDKKLEQKEKEFARDLDAIKKDMLTVVEAMQHGGASTALLELTNKNQNTRKELERGLASFDVEREDMKVKIEKLESGNFFGLRRNEEMGTKIYHMQIELEDLDRKHRLELEAYQNQEEAGAINELVKVNEELDKKIRKSEQEIVTSKEKSIEEMELLSMKIHEEKRIAVSEMTDTVLSLEAIIDEMKERHELDIREFEERSQEEKFVALDEMQEKIEQLELMLANCKKDCEEKLACQDEEHKTETRRMEETLKSKLEYYKMKSEERPNLDNAESNGSEKRIKELEGQVENHEANLRSTIDEMQKTFSQQMEEKQQYFENQINDIRNEYEEKLKSCIKENARRQSVSSRKTETQKIKELTSKLEELELANEEQKRAYESKIDDFQNMVQQLQALVAELRGDNPLGKADVSSEQIDPTGEDDPDSKNRVKELENQIERYEKRIDYYREKSEREEADENARVGELQQEVEELRHEMKELTQKHQKEAEEPAVTDEDQGKVIRRRRSEGISDAPAQERQRYKRWSDLHLMDVVFTSDGVEQKRGPRDRDSKKRWSDLQLKQDSIISKIGELDDKRNPKLLTQLKRDEIAKSGSVARRKKLWENYKTDEPRKLQRPLSSIRP